jgi:L-aspartate oxidase
MRAILIMHKVVLVQFWLPSDSVENHIQVIVTGAYLCDEETINMVCIEGPYRIREVMAISASSHHGEDGNLHLAREGGHSHH